MADADARIARLEAECKRLKEQLRQLELRMGRVEQENRLFLTQGMN